MDSQQLVQVRNSIEFRYNPPQHFNQQLVYGKVMRLFKIKDVQRHFMAVEAVAGGKLFNVVVKDEKVSKELI